jgi:hypothetical protein
MNNLQRIFSWYGGFLVAVGLFVFFTEQLNSIIFLATVVSSIVTIGASRAYNRNPQAASIIVGFVSLTLGLLAGSRMIGRPLSSYIYVLDIALIAVFSFIVLVAVIKNISGSKRASDVSSPLYSISESRMPTRGNVFGKAKGLLALLTIVVISAAGIVIKNKNDQANDPSGYYFAYVSDGDTGRRIWLKPDGSFETLYRTRGGGVTQGPSGSYSINGEIAFNFNGETVTGYYGTELFKIPGSLTQAALEMVLRTHLSATDSSGIHETELVYVRRGKDPGSSEGPEWNR